MSTHNVCIGSNIRKLAIPLHTPVLLYKVGYAGVYITRTCFLDGRFESTLRRIFFKSW